MSKLNPHELEGMYFGKIRCDRRVGKGGMAYVYQGEHTDLKQPVAIKVLFRHHSQSLEKRMRFQREAQVQFRLQHPNLVRTLDLINEQGILAIVMDWIEGEDLMRHAHRYQGVIPWGDLLQWFTTILDVVGYAHNQQVIHRDLKPANILLAKRNHQLHPKVADFGIAKLLDQHDWMTREGVMLGTPAYMAPEQAQAQSLDHRVDIYALGVSLFQMATGQLPFRGKNVLEVLAAHRDQPVPYATQLNPALPTSLQPILEKAMHKQPEQRFESCQAFLDALQPFIHEHNQAIHRANAASHPKQESSATPSKSDDHTLYDPPQHLLATPS
ncbi:MAG: serine/threonine-protein kinase, partial [Myxococcota bacterium]